MEQYESWDIKGGILEYLNETHTYIYEGKILPSITTILKYKFGNKYDGIPEEVLKRAAERGTEIHETIENFEKHKIDDVCSTELRNWKFLKKAYKFKCIDNEVPVVIFKDGDPIACGRLDLVLDEDGQVGLGDIKTTSTLDKEYLAYQLNLYRLGYQQCYDQDILFLRAVWLRKDVRKYVNIPINENAVKEFINEFIERNEK